MIRSLTETTPPHARSNAAFVPAVLAGIAVAMLFGGGTATACPSGPRPTGAYDTYVAACAGSDDHVVPINAGQGGFFVSATETGGLALLPGLVNASASVGTILGDPAHPDLHASVFGQVGSTIHLSGSLDGEAMADFRDIVIPRHNRRDAGFFRLDFALDGIFANPPADPENNYGIVALNIGIEKWSNPSVRAGGGIGFSTVQGIYGPVSTTVEVGMNVSVGAQYVLTGELSVRAFGTASNGDTTDFAADFGTTAKFLGVHFFTDETQTEELFDFTLESAFGFNYLNAAPPVNDVVEPGSLALLASAVGLLGVAWRRRGAAVSASA